MSVQRTASNTGPRTPWRTRTRRSLSREPDREFGPSVFSVKRFLAGAATWPVPCWADHRTGHFGQRPVIRDSDGCDQVPRPAEGQNLAVAGSASVARPIFKNVSRMLTRRVRGRMFLLRPSMRTNQVVRYFVAVMARAPRGRTATLVPAESAAPADFRVSARSAATVNCFDVATTIPNSVRVPKSLSRVESFPRRLLRLSLMPRAVVPLVVAISIRSLVLAAGSSIRILSGNNPGMAHVAVA